jgi:O-succinylbenzoic acid--CoA ligase
MKAHILLNGKKVDVLSAQKALKGKLPEWEKDIYSFLLEWWSPKAFVSVHTSGSTGAPKEIQRLKEKMRISARMTGKYFSFHSNAKILLCLPAKFIAGKMMLVRAIEWGMDCDYIEPSIHLDIPKKDFFFSAMTPQQAQANNSKLASIDHILLGGAPVSKSLENQLSTSKPHFYVSFGMTETVSHIAIRDLRAKNPDIYNCLDDVWLSTDSNDQLIIHADRLLSKSLITTDYVQLINSKQFIWQGRSDFIINSGGLKISPEKIESQISNLIIPDFIVHGKPDEKWGEVPILIIEGTPLNISNLQSEIERVVPKNQVPKEVYFVSTFTKTDNGKINRKGTFDQISFSQANN